MNKKYDDVYKEELREKRGDAWVKGIILFFFSLMFVFYVKEMFDQVLLDGKSKVKIENQGETIRYIMETGTIEVSGVKDRDKEATLTQIGPLRNTEYYKITFSEPRDWEHSQISLYNSEGYELYSKQYDGYDGKKLEDNQIYMNELYDLLIGLALCKGTRLRGEMIYFALACTLIILGILSLKVWKWFFFKYKIGWAVDRGTIPSIEYKYFINIVRFVLFLLIIYFILRSYGINTANIFQGNPYSWLE